MLLNGSMKIFLKLKLYSMTLLPHNTLLTCTMRDFSSKSRWTERSSRTESEWSLRKKDKAENKPCGMPKWLLRKLDLIGNGS